MWTLLFVFSCGLIAFDANSLKRKDAQRVWIFTNDDRPIVPDQEEAQRVLKQVQVIFDCVCYDNLPSERQPTDDDDDDDAAAADKTVEPCRTQSFAQPFLHHATGQESF